MKIKNYGVIIEKRKTDYIAGKESAIGYEAIDGNWERSLPTKEPQGFAFDTMSCVTFSATNLIEDTINEKIKLGLISKEATDKMKSWGFFDEQGSFNCSDRFTAKMSGTKTNGNTLQAVWDSIRKDGLVPESVWPAGGKTWDEYMSEIPQQVKDFAKNILTVLDFQYEWLITGQCGTPDMAKIKEALRQCPLQIAAPVCPADSTGTYQPCGSCITQHATIIYKADGENFWQFDSYDPYSKKLSKHYSMPYILKAVVTEKKPAPIPEVKPFDHVFNQDLWYGQRSNEIAHLQRALIRLGYKTFDTGYYGPLTKAAVYEFQKKYAVANIVILWWNQGKYFGPLTMAKINEVLKVA
jgi:hypothetical protein